METYASNSFELYVLIRSNYTFYQWLPEFNRLSNTIEFAMFYENGSEYSIENATDEHAFTLWLDNRILPSTLNLLKNVGLDN